MPALSSWFLGQATAPDISPHGLGGYRATLGSFAPRRQHTGNRTAAKMLVDWVLGIEANDFLLVHLLSWQSLTMGLDLAIKGAF
jgi:hypothetical protein